MRLILKVLNAEWILKKPYKKDVLIYDKKSSDFADLFFKKKSCEFLCVRFESINLYIIYITLLKSGFKNFKDNYKKNFIERVSPKIVFTAIDNNPAFYNLKNIIQKPIYISLQNGMRDNQFYEQCKILIKKKRMKLKADYIFLFGESEKKRFSKIIKGKISCIGNAINNHYKFNSKNIKKKIRSIMYVSQYNISMFEREKHPIDTFEEDKKIFNKLNTFCNKKNIKLIFCSKVGRSLENFFREKFSKGKWIYYPRESRHKTYKRLNEQQMVVFGYSTLGFEALAKGLRCVSFYKNFPIEGSYLRYPKSGSFWTDSLRYSDFENILNKVINFSNKNWKMISNKYSEQILSYNPGNTKVKKILNRILEV
tara:strand:- start:7407 stop:8507 length:1101 start_codon:yes stop_codon:yes gene_type:complete